MQRKEFADYPFEAKKFKEALIIAVGGRSQTDFCKSCGLSFAYLNRYLNEKNYKPPTVATIAKIADATSDIDFGGLLEAAGYDPKKYEVDDYAPAVKRDVIYPVMRAISASPFSWQVRSEGIEDGKPFEIEIDHDDVTNWYIIPVEKSDVTMEDIQGILLSKGWFKSKSKVSFITEQSEVFEKLKSFEFPLLSLYLSTILIKNDRIKEECDIKSSLKCDIKINKDAIVKPFTIK